MKEYFNRRSDTWYSGDFKVTCGFKGTIQVKNWSGFENAQPPRGFFSETIHAEASYSTLAHFPGSTTVSWVVGEDSRVMSQVLELRGVVPLCKEGVTLFNLGDDGVWTVAFIPGRE